ncbi:MAG: NAD(+) diphosphatase [Opitutus sp.]
MSFVHLHSLAATPKPDDCLLVIQGDRLLAEPNVAQVVVLPRYSTIRQWSQVNVEAVHLGLIEGRALWAVIIDDAETSAPSGFAWHETRALLAVFTPAQWQAISCARQLLWWERRHRYCGVCGTPTAIVSEERARRCPQCNSVFFPVVSSAVIVAVTQGEQLLLAHNRNFRPGMFSLLAGFVDPGETLEQAAVREVHEETGIVIGSLEYVTSQPWPFPNSLMVGFRAQYVSGDIAVDGREIEEAAWFERTALPEIPRPGTIARLIIDQWRNG